MAHTFNIPTTNQPLNVTVENGNSVIFVGPNGGGKTRLAVHIENSVQANAHRISAHRALNLNPKVAKISEDQATLGLLVGNHSQNYGVGKRAQFRWGNRQATQLLNDYDYVCAGAVC